MSAVHEENPFAGQGAVLLDIGGDVGALVVEMPDALEGLEVEIRPARLRPATRAGAADLGHAHVHHPHVAVVRRPVLDGLVASLVFGEVVAGSYVLVVKGTDEVCLQVEVRGGEVTQAAWPREPDRPRP